MVRPSGDNKSNFIMITTAEEARNIVFESIRSQHEALINDVCARIREAAENLQPQVDITIESNDARKLVGRYLVHLGYEVWEQRDILTIIWKNIRNDR